MVWYEYSTGWAPGCQVWCTSRRLPWPAPPAEELRIPVWGFSDQNTNALSGGRAGNKQPWQDRWWLDMLYSTLDYTTLQQSWDKLQSWRSRIGEHSGNVRNFGKYLENMGNLVEIYETFLLKSLGFANCFQADFFLFVLLKQCCIFADFRQYSFHFTAFFALLAQSQFMHFSGNISRLHIGSGNALAVFSALHYSRLTPE